ncbi:hypothetical protein VYU27_000904 [Nannochloropsis oceanica]
MRQLAPVLSFVISLALLPDVMCMVLPVRSKPPSAPPPPRVDNAIERFFIRAMARKLATITPDQAPFKPNPTFDEMALSTMQLLDPASDPLIQSAKIARLLEEVTPPFLRFLFRTFGGSRFGCEANALVAPLFSQWLVGPSKRVEGPVKGDTWQSTMLIEECRYLKSVDGCRHACVYLCKVPTQTFFKESLNMDVTMTPDFNDNSCRMCFGQAPPASLDDDPVMLATDGVPCLATVSCCGATVGKTKKKSRSKEASTEKEELICK